MMVVVVVVTEMVLETSAQYRQLTRLIAREDFIKSYDRYTSQDQT
jgi:hypothetical protein